MTAILRITFVLTVLTTVLFARGAGGRLRPRDKKDDITMEKPPRKGKSADAKKDARAPKKKAPEVPKDPFEAAVFHLATWPSPEAREAAASLALKGPTIEPKLIERLAGATPGLSAGIAFVLGEVGGDAAVPALQAIASRPSMADHLPEVFTAIGKLEGTNAVRRILPYLRHPKRSARIAAERWLNRHVTKETAPRLIAFLEESSPGARTSAFRLLVNVAPEAAKPHAFRRLDDGYWELALASARFLAEVGDDEDLKELNADARGPLARRSAYAVVALVIAAAKRGNQVFEEETVTMLLDSHRGMKAAEKLNRGVAAIALAEIGYDSDRPEIDKLLDNEIIDVLLDTLGGRAFFKDYPALSEPARDRFGLLTGIIERRPIPELWRWWHENRDDFVARRALRSIDPEQLHTLRVRARSSVEPALTTTLFSTEPEDALKPDNVGLVFVHLLDREARDLADLLSREFLTLPDWGTVDPNRAIRSGDRAAVGPAVVVTVSANGRSRTAAGRKGAMPKGLLDLVLRLRQVRDAFSWQRYWDRNAYGRFEDFLETEGAFFASGPTPQEMAGRLKKLILGSLDDLATTALRNRALDHLVSLEVELTDSDCYRLAMFLGSEDGLTPFAVRAGRLLAGAGRSIGGTLMTDWAEKNPGTKSIDLLALTFEHLGKDEIRKAAKSERVVVRRAAMRAAATSLGGESKIAVLEVGALDRVIVVRREALRALGASGEAAAIDVLTKAMEDKSPEVRSTAVEALGSLARPEVIPILNRELSSDDPGRRISAVRALCASKLDAAITPVLGVLRSDASAVVREIAAREISAFGIRVMDGLSRIALSIKADPAVRVLAVEAIVDLGGTAAATLLTALLSDPAPDVADSAALALSSVGRKNGVPHLLEALTKGRSRSRIVGALEQLSCQSFPRAKASELVAIYKGWWNEHKTESTGQWFADALARKGYGSPMLMTLANERPDRRVSPLLIGAMADEEWFIRANANLWLQRITGQSFGTVDRFSAPEQIRSIQELWQAWWEKQ